MILFTLIALSVLSGIACTFIFEMIQEWYDFWMILVSSFAFFIAYLLIFVLFIAVYTSCISLKKEAKPSKFCHGLIKRVCELLIQVFKIKVHVRGMENLPLDQKCLFVSNHISNFDPIVCEWLFRGFDLSFIIKNSLMKVPFLKNALHKDLHLPLDRNNNRQGLEVVLKSIKLIKEDKRSVFVYPEGTRSKDGILAELHSGTFKIAEKSKAPIVVVTVTNTEVVRKRWLFKATNVYVDVTKVLYYEDYKDLQTTEISEKVYGIMQESLNELSELKY